MTTTVQNEESKVGYIAKLTQLMTEFADLDQKIERVVPRPGGVIQSGVGFSVCESASDAKAITFKWRQRRSEVEKELEQQMKLADRYGVSEAELDQIISAVCPE